MKRDCIVEELWRSIAVKSWRSVCSRILELVGTAFVFGAVLQIVQIVVFDTLGIDRMLGGFMWISLIVVPVTASMAVSYFCHSDQAYTIVTGVATSVFAVSALRLYLIG
jgi:hypothetical protein